MQQRWFFFSSRRRHTRLTCDWSSDVCSSDLTTVTDFFTNLPTTANSIIKWLEGQGIPSANINNALASIQGQVTDFEIGRASCREGGQMMVRQEWLSKEIIYEVEIHRMQSVRV